MEKNLYFISQGEWIMAVEEKNKVQEIVNLLKKDGVDAGKSE